MQQNMVLVIAEDASINELVCLVLGEEPDLQVVAVDTDTEAEQVARRVRPELIVLDWMGWSSRYRSSSEQVVWALKTNPFTRSIPVLALVYFDDSLEDVKEAGCTGYVVKPFEVGEFVREVRRYLPMMQKEAS